MRGGEGLRVDLAMTLFLSDPKSYEGGELVIETLSGGIGVKLAAGDAVVYPASTLHRVAPVKSGTRFAAITWVRSLVRDPAQRQLLAELEMAMTSFESRVPDARAELGFDRAVRLADRRQVGLGLDHEVARAEAGRRDLVGRVGEFEGEREHFGDIETVLHHGKGSERVRANVRVVALGTNEQDGQEGADGQENDARFDAFVRAYYEQIPAEDLAAYPRDLERDADFQAVVGEREGSSRSAR